MQLRMSLDELSLYLQDQFPQAGSRGFGVQLVEMNPGHLTVAMPTDHRHLRPGGTVSGPTLFALADIASYLCILAHLGPVPGVLTTNMSINFLRRPSAGRVVARTDLLKLGRRLAVAETSLFSQTDPEGEPCAHAVGTYALPTD